MEAFAHAEYNKEIYNGAKHVEKCIETGSDLFRRQTKKKKIDESFFPKDLLKIMEEKPQFYQYGGKITEIPFQLLPRMKSSGL